MAGNLTEVIAREVTKSLIRSTGDAAGIMVGIHNAFVFGDVLEQIGWDTMGDDNEKFLNELFKGLDKCTEALRKIKELNE